MIGIVGGIKSGITLPDERGWLSRLAFPRDDRLIDEGWGCPIVKDTEIHESQIEHLELDIQHQIT